MSRRSRFILPAALVAALTTAGCFPIASNHQAAQQDVIGDVNVSADVCTAPQLLIGGIYRSELRTAASRDLSRLAARGVPSEIEDLFTCPTKEELFELLEDEPFFGIPHQLLVAYRVPAGAGAPETFQASGVAAVSGEWHGVPRGGGEPTEQNVDLTFRRAPEMDAQLNKLYDLAYEGLDDAPAIVRPGEKVVGYISSQLPGPLVGKINVKAGFGLPAGTADQPYAGPFNALTMVGSRIALTEDELRSGARSVSQLRAARGTDPDFEDVIGPDRPVECLDDELPRPVRGVGDEFALAWCPFPTTVIVAEDPVEELEKALAGVDAQTRDLRILGGEGFAEQGSAASVPFTLRGAGAPSDAQLALTSGTALGGATAAPAQATTPFPGAGDHRQTVNVQVPENAAPGTYTVTLTATVGGQTRTGTGRVVVLPKQVNAPSQGRGRDNVYMDSDGYIAFGWICPPACGNDQADVIGPKNGIAPKANTAAVSKPRLLRIARGKFKAAAGKRARVKVRLFPKARRAIRRGRNVKAIIVVRTGGKGIPSVRRVTIKQRKPKR